MGGDDARDLVAGILTEELGLALPAESTDLLATGLLDSLGLVTLLSALEARLRLTIDVQELDLSDFRTVPAIVAFVERQATPEPPVG